MEPFETLSLPHISLPDAKSVSVVVANAIPVIGLLAFDMSAAALLTFYWLELGVLSVWAIVRALFAGKRPTKQTEREAFSGSQWATFRVIASSSVFDRWRDSFSIDHSWKDIRVTIPRTDVGIYLGTIPALVFVIFFLAVVWVGFGGVVAGPVLAATNATDLPVWVLTGTGVVFLSEGGQTARDYFYRGRYRETSVSMAFKQVFYQGLIMVAAGLVVLLIAYEFAEGRAVSIEGAASGPLIFLAVAGKFLIELTMHYLDRLDEPLREKI
ncbi:MAG: hypothetical protein J07HN6_02497 [Halonotius sp. J07HN6]|nr:MAG: hypothetical protein J07HN6_02497 [Halonotius sp. J07HN6]